jgi:hypothetical protein
LPASRYLKPIQLTIALGPDGYLGAKLMNTSTSAINLGGLTVHGGTLSAGIDHGQLTYALDGATLTLPKNIGEGSLSIQGNGAQEPSFDASLSINVPKLQPGVMTFHADATGYKATGSTGVDFKQASGTVTFGLEKVGDDKALWSAAGTIGYNSERLSGQVSVQYNADGALSGDGSLNFQIADFLTGQATVAIDKEGHVAVNGEIRPPNETQLFPEKKIEQTFFHNSIEFPIWGISIPVVGSVGLIAFIEGSMGYRVGVGAGVMRNIVLSGSYSTDPSVQPTFQIAGEIFIPAFAELLISIGGGIKLDAFIADIGGGLKIDGRAGFYGGLSVRPTLAYEGGKYRLVGQAILGGDVGLQAQLDAFAKLHVGKWMFSWEKEWDWKLGEWDKWLGLHLGMEADLDYTLGQPLSPDIFKLKKPDALDVQAIAKSAVPKDGMPAQGHKGAENQDTEFHAKSGGAAAPATSTAAQPKIAPTPAGAAGHKNQDTKGKDVKPAAPPKPEPAKKAKGKDASQTGPNPQNKSKPNETKLDATPIVEPFSMNGESHQLIVQLGPSGHVDMASKRERLSVKVGQAVGKLIAKHAPPQQVTELKALGALAKNGDQMALKAKTPDKDGTKKVAHQIAEYGAKWGVKDLDEVAVKAPHALTAHSVHLDKLSDPLSKALTAAHTGQVIANKAGDPKELTRQLLEHHADAHFDFASAQLTLPTLQAAALQAATSLEALGEALVQQTGVAKITLKKTDQKGESKLELTGAIGSASATLVTADISATDIKTACEQVGGVAKTKYNDVMAEHQAGAVAVRPPFLTGATARLKPDPKKPLEAMRSEVSDGGDKYILKGDQIPLTEILGQQGISRVIDLPSVFNYYLEAGYKARLKLTTADDFLQACAAGKFNPKTDLNDGAEIRGKVAESWWFAKARAGGVTLGQIKKDLTVMDTTYDKGMLRLNISAAELSAAHITLHKPTAFDGMMQGWGNDPMWTAAPGSTWGLTRDGMQEGVIKASKLGVFKDRHLILPEPMPKVSDVEVPKKIVEPNPATIAKPSEQLATQIEQASSGQIIHAGGAPDAKAATKKLLDEHPNAKLENGTLTLPPVSDAAVASADSLSAVGNAIAAQTGVSSVKIEKKPDAGADFIGQINPTVVTGSVPKPPPLDPAVVRSIGEERLVRLFPSWEGDVKKSMLEDTPSGITTKAKVWGPGYKLTPGITAPATTAAVTSLQAAAQKPNAPHTQTALRKSLEEKEGDIKVNFQEAAGHEVAKEVAADGRTRAGTASVQQDISNSVRFENNLQLGRINMPGTGEVAHNLYEPDPATFADIPHGTARKISFNYKPPYQNMHFSVDLDAAELVTKSEAKNITLKQADGTAGRGGMNQSPAHQTNAGMHNAHVIADMVRGSGYRNAHNLISTSSTYNLVEMGRAEDAIAAFVNRIDPTAKFDLTVTLTWEQLDSPASVAAILVRNKDWQGATAAAVQTEIANYLAKLKGGSKLQRVMSTTYEVTVYPENGAARTMKPPFKLGPDVYLGV